jgi:hypothetical protein
VPTSDQPNKVLDKGFFDSLTKILTKYNNGDILFEDHKAIIETYLKAFKIPPQRGGIKLHKTTIKNKKNNKNKTKYAKKCKSNCSLHKRQRCINISKKIKRKIPTKK